MHHRIRSLKVDKDGNFPESVENLVETWAWRGAGFREVEPDGAFEECEACDVFFWVANV